MPRNERYSVSHREASTVRDYPNYRYDDSEKRFSSTFLIVLVSLLFVAVFGGALVGGVVSGDPSNGFFITIIAASGVAISVAALVSLRYCYQQRAARYQRDYAIKENSTEDIRGTFTRSHEEDEEMGYHEPRGRYYPTQGHIEEQIKEVDARSMAPGDVSAMSPTTYDFESYAQTASQFTRSEYNGNGYRLNIEQPYPRQERQGPFDFSGINTPCRQDFPMREDPPEDNIGCNMYCGMPLSKDPTAAVASADGSLVVDKDPVVDEAPDDDAASEGSMSPSNRSELSRYDVPGEEDIIAETSDRESEITSEVDQSSRKRERSKSPKKDRRPKGNPAPPPPPPPPRSTKAKTSSTSARNTQSSKSEPGTPLASEAGSSVSSLFLKQFAGMFGKKRTPSEAGYSDASSNIKTSEAGTSKRSNKSKEPDVKAAGSEIDNHASGNEGRPPMPGKKKSNRGTNLATIEGSNNKDRYAPSTPGRNSAFNVPPPRRIPSTPGSEAPSEFRSVAASSVFSNGVASSTFDPGARDRAVRRSQRNTSALGANFNDMPIFYDEEESAAQSVAPSAAPSSTAASEPTAHSVGYDVFAPPGPIGMVVDTVDQGCVVHSLKKTSPMQGLINPGDLIVAMDDVDVRNLDAAALTKLMAKKSQQKERKFTLIPADEY